jgi:hypothetical protein
MINRWRLHQVRRLLSRAAVNTPSVAPSTLPRPPNMLAPPKTTAAITSSSMPINSRGLAAQTSIYVGDRQGRPMHPLSTSASPPCCRRLSQRPLSRPTLRCAPPRRQARWYLFATDIKDDDEWGGADRRAAAVRLRHADGWVCSYDPPCLNASVLDCPEQIRGSNDNCLHTALVPRRDGRRPRRLPEVASWCRHCQTR